MIKTVSLLIGSFLLPQVDSENARIRYEIATQMQHMIGVPESSIKNTISEQHVRATPKNFCKRLLSAYHHELMTELLQCGFSHEEIQQKYHINRKKIIEDDDSRRLKPLEKAAKVPVKKMVHALADRWKIKHKIRVINAPDGTNIGSARITELFLDEERWENAFDKDPRVLQFIAGHELTHILHEDIALDLALNEVQKKNLSGHSAVKTETCEAISRLSKFCEVRADIYSALDSKRALKGYLFWTKRDLEVCGDEVDKDHPLTSDRLQLAGLLQKLYATYQPQPRKRKRE